MNSQKVPGTETSAEPAIDDALLKRYSVSGPRYTSYPTAPEWTGDFGIGDHAAALERAGQSGEDRPLSFYVHLPFCREMCSFCGCNAIVTHDAQKPDRYLDRIVGEMDQVSTHLGGRRRLSQIHWGGGTPTFLTPPQLKRLWQEIRARFEPVDGAEIAIEVNPSLTDLADLDALRSFGFNRLSMGVQDFDPQVQQAIGRVQSVEQTRALLEHAHGVGFSGVNLDLIYGLPHQTPESWSAALDQVLALRPDRLAVYGFAYLPKLRPQQRRLPADALPSGPVRHELFRLARQKFLSNGYVAIGMDHFAVPEDPLAVAKQDGTLWRNFQGYTVRKAPDTVAFGLSAISDIAGVYAQNERGLKAYQDAIDGGRLATARGLRLTDDDLRRREIITDVMCNFRVDLGPKGETLYAQELRDLQTFVDDGLVELHGPRVELTPTGRVLVRNVAMAFDARLRAQSGDDRPTFSMTV